MSNADGSASRSWESTDTSPVVSLYLTGKVNLKNIKALATKPVDYTEVLNQFVTDYSTLLNANDITIEDKATVEQAAAEFAALPAEVRDARYDIQLTLEALRAKSPRWRRGKATTSTA